MTQQLRVAQIVYPARPLQVPTPLWVGARVAFYFTGRAGVLLPAPYPLDLGREMGCADTRGYDLGSFSARKSSVVCHACSAASAW